MGALQRATRRKSTWHPGAHRGSPRRERHPARLRPGRCRRDLRAIADDLHCTAVRIGGGDPERLSAAAEEAAAAGLEVWFAPFPCELAPDEMTALFTDCAERAERVRRGGAEVVLVTGCEVSLFAKGFVPGDDAYARIAALFESEGVDSAFWFTYAGFGLPHDPADPVHDLDMASYGVVPMAPDGTRHPKAAFHALAAAYAAQSR